MFEGYGGPVQIRSTDAKGIDPTLESCCAREVCMKQISCDIV